MEDDRERELKPMPKRRIVHGAGASIAEGEPPSVEKKVTLRCPASCGIVRRSMSHRRTACALAASLVPFLSAPSARAEPSADQTATATTAERSTLRLQGFEVLASAGYGIATSPIRNLELEPYGASFGLDLGYTFAAGFRVGAGVGYGLGGTVEQRHEPALAPDFDFSSDASSLNVAVSLGYDVSLAPFVLRYTVNLGGSFMRWDLGGVPPDTILGSGAWKSPTAGFFLAPGLTLLFPNGPLQCGVGFDYYVQTSGKIPLGFLGEALVGVKL
jgi:hypothetical protein